jgi:hypothetical protein
MTRQRRVNDVSAGPSLVARKIGDIERCGGW